MQNSRIFLLTILIAISIVLTSSPVSALYISEIMYNPAGEDNNHEYLELYTDSEVNLQNWRIGDLRSNDSLSLLKGDFIIQGGEYVLVVESGFNFSAYNVPDSVTVLSSGSTIGNNLNNDKDTVFIYDESLNLIDSASYTNDLANGNGKSLQLLNEWCEGIPTPGKENNCIEAMPDNGSEQTSPQQPQQEETQTSQGDVNYEVAAPKEIYLGEEFKVRVKVLNTQDENVKVEVWSYVYRGSKCYSCLRDREENADGETVSVHSSETISLKNTVREAEPGKYSLKIKIQEEGVNTIKEFTFDIQLLEPSIFNSKEENSSISQFTSKSNETNKALNTEESQPIEKSATEPKSKSITSEATRSISKTRQIGYYTNLFLMLIVLILIYLIWWKKVK